MLKSRVRESRFAARLLGFTGLLALAGAGAAVAAELRHRDALARDPQWALLRSPLRGSAVPVTSADGTVLHAEAFGAEAAPTFVLVPGWTEQLELFDLLTRGLLGRGFRVVGYDLRGQGRSGAGPGLDQRIERYGEDLEAILGATCAGRNDVIVVGHSMGGMSVVAWASSHVVPRHVRGAALVSTGVSELLDELALLPESIPVPARREILTSLLGGASPVPAVSTPLTRALTRYALFGPGASAALVAFVEPMIWNMDPQPRAAAALTMREIDLRRALSGLTVPTLVVAGERDRLTPPAHARRMVAVLPHVAEFLLLPQTGHMVPLERPTELLEALVRLAESVGLATAGGDAVVGVGAAQSQPV